MEIEDDKVMVDEILLTRMGRGGPRLYGLARALSGRLEIGRAYRVTVSAVPDAWALDATLAPFNGSGIGVDGVRTMLESLGAKPGQWFRLEMHPRARPEDVAVGYSRFTAQMRRSQGVTDLAKKLGLGVGDDVTLTVTLMEE